MIDTTCQNVFSFVHKWLKIDHFAADHPLVIRIPRYDAIE